MSDLDGWLLESIPTNDGIWSLYGFDDDRPMAAWSGPHLERALAQRTLTASRVAAAEWALGDLERRGASAAHIAKVQGEVAAAKAEWSAWDAQVRRQLSARSE